MFIWLTVKFFVFFLFFIFIPAKLIFKLFRLEIKDELVDLGLNIAFGIVLITLLSSFLSIYKSLHLLTLLPFISIFILIVNSKDIKEYYLKKICNLFALKKTLVLVFILLGVVCQNLVLFRGGWQYGSYFAFPSVHDNFWNIAISSESLLNFPPQNPAISGVLLKNNHYFYPFFLSIIKYFTNIPLFDLYFRFGPLLVSFLFGISLYTVASIFIENNLFRILTIFLGYFSGNIAYILPFFFGQKFDWKGNSFFADQPFDQMINPYSVLGFAFILFGVYSIAKIEENHKIISWSIIGGFLLGGIYAFKSFGGIIAISSLIFLYAAAWIGNKKRLYFPLLIISLTIFLILFLFISNMNERLVNWAPGWILTQMMTDKDKLNLPEFANVEAFYQSTENYLGLLKVKFMEFIIYLIGNLGLRLAGGIYLIFFLINLFKKKAGRQFTLLFIFLSITIAFFIPLFFNLKFSPFNIIQFTPYALVLLSIMTSLALEKIFNCFNKRGKPVIGFLIIIITIIFLIPVNVKNLIEKIPAPSDKITNEEMDGLLYLKSKAANDEMILVDPHDFEYDTGFDPIYISGITEKKLYLASRDYAQQTGYDPSSHMQNTEAFFKEGKGDFLEKNNIRYLYLFKKRQKRLAELKTKFDLSTVFENNQVIILKFNSYKNNINDT